VRRTAALLFFGTDAEALDICCRKERAYDKTNLEQWKVNSSEHYKAWLRSIGVEDSVSHLKCGACSMESLQEPARRRTVHRR